MNLISWRPHEGIVQEDLGSRVLPAQGPTLADRPGLQTHLPTARTHGIAIALIAVMTTSRWPTGLRNRLGSVSRPIVSWVLERDHQSLTCEVDRANSSFEVAVVPHWDVSASTIETFGSPANALQRHAEIILALRQRGWALTSYMPVHGQQLPAA
jgi:hypothetical protein